MKTCMGCVPGTPCHCDGEWEEGALYCGLMDNDECRFTGDEPCGFDAVFGEQS